MNQAKRLYCMIWRPNWLSYFGLPLHVYSTNLCLAVTRDVHIHRAPLAKVALSSQRMSMSCMVSEIHCAELVVEGFSSTGLCSRRKDSSAVRLSGQHLPQPHSRSCIYGCCKEGGSGGRVRHRFLWHGWGQPRLVLAWRSELS